MPDPKNLPTYTNEEVVSILTRALDQQHDGARISHDELLETAREIGVTTLEIEAAVAAEVKVRAERLLLEEERALAIRRFARHAIVFVITNALLAAIDLKFAGGVFFYWVGIGWGALLGVHGWRALAPLAEPPAAAPPPRVEVRAGKLEIRGAPDRLGEAKAGAASEAPEADQRKAG